MSKSSPFDSINAINDGNKDATADGFVPFIANKQFSYFPDTIFAANEMNRRAHLDEDAQFAFYINIVRPRKRYSKWAKTQHSEDELMLIEKYGYNPQRAREVVDLLSSEDKDSIRKSLEKGGLKK